MATDKFLEHMTDTLDNAMKSIEYNDLKTVHLLVGIYDIVQNKIRTFVQSILSQFTEITSIQFNPDFISSLSSYIARYYKNEVNDYQIEAIDNILDPSISDHMACPTRSFRSCFIICAWRFCNCRHIHGQLVIPTNILIKVLIYWALTICVKFAECCNSL
jgi:hypothetical protein